MRLTVRRVLKTLALYWERPDVER